MNKTLTKILTPLASLRITVTLIVLTVLLVFVGTTAQKDLSSWDVQRDYFYAWGVMAPLKYFFPLMKLSETAPGKVPMVGGYTIAIAMLVNLLAANVLRFRLGWKDLLAIPPLVALVWGAGQLTYTHGYYALSAALILASLPLCAAMYWLHGKRGGVVLIHLGLILVLGGELVTNAVKIEQNMSIDEGGYANYASDIRYGEFAVMSPAPGDKVHNVTINEKRLIPGTTVSDARLPFDVKVDAYYPNSDLLGPMQAKPKDVPEATAGAGLKLGVQPIAKGAGVGRNNADYPAAFVTLISKGKELGRYLVSQQLNPQSVEVDGKTYQIALRWPRYYKPFELRLKDFRFDRLTGTNRAKNYSSLIQLVNPSTGENREVKIWMNHPLRYDGETFYQSNFDPKTETTTILQVVRNPSWVFPYIACVVGALGLVSHFGSNLREFARKRAKADADARNAAAAAAASGKRGKGDYTLPPRSSLADFLAPAGAAVLCLMYLVNVVIPHSNGDASSETGMNLKAAAAIPMNYEGRVLPFDTLARVSLKVITGGREDLSKVEGKPPVMQFLFETFTRSDRAREYKMFKINNSEVIGLMGLNPVDPKTHEERDLFSWAEMEPKIETLQQQVMATANIDEKHQTVFQRKLGDLWRQVKTFDSLAALGSMFLIPPEKAGGEWRQFGPLVDEARQTGKPDPALYKFVTMLDAYGKKDADAFNKAVGDYRAQVEQVAPGALDKAGFEVFFNRIAPFYHLLGFYVLAFVLVLVSFLVAPRPLRRAAWAVLIITIVCHTLGLGMRMYLQGRPPVTTLYSSAIFIAWGGAILALGLEWFYKNGVGLMVSCAVGFLSLFIAHNLAAADGDSLRQLEAVLDTNFWLATHVVLITLGYASTFVAGSLAIVYLVRGIFTTSLDKAAGKELTRMTYGILCFAILFSFVGTVLGGIWADQSWGRFWGWDPKENGAILIVLWNALILHSRWAGLVKERGIALLAVFGNCVTAWSYFGTNELGIGLHSYGFTEGRAFWLLMFFASQVAIIAMGLILPQTAWRSASLLTSSATGTSTKANRGAALTT